jgi:hypothetical protein
MRWSNETVPRGRGLALPLSRSRSNAVGRSRGLSGRSSRARNVTRNFARLGFSQLGARNPSGELARTTQRSAPADCARLPLVSRFRGLHSLRSPGACGPAPAVGCSSAKRFAGRPTEGRAGRRSFSAARAGRFSDFPQGGAYYRYISVPFHTGERPRSCMRWRPRSCMKRGVLAPTILRG